MSTTTTTVAPTTLEATAPPYDAQGNVKATITFYVPPADGSVPYNYVEKQPEGVAQNNYGSASHEVTITNMRPNESSFEIDKHGFAVFKAGNSENVDFYSDESIEKNYYPEVEKTLLDNIPGSHKIVIFDHTVRRAANSNAKRAPVLRAHIDQTAGAARLRVPRHVPDKEESDKLLQGRFRIVNVWRPLNGPVESHPLAVGDSQTFPDENLIPVEHRYPDRTGHTAGVSYNEKIKWYYLDGMRNDERLFLQCFDSVSGARVPHTAFNDPRSTENSKPRESIEVRALVFG